jgi:hypothetical protein
MWYDGSKWIIGILSPPYFPMYYTTSCPDPQEPNLCSWTGNGHLEWVGSCTECKRSSSSSSFSSGYLEDQYCISGLNWQGVESSSVSSCLGADDIINGTYDKVPAFHHNEKPVYRNINCGSFYLVYINPDPNENGPYYWAVAIFDGIDFTPVATNVQPWMPAGFYVGSAGLGWVTDGDCPSSASSASSPDLSESSRSSRFRSSSSSSVLLPKGLTYLSTCRSLEGISNPEAGQEAKMYFKGHFDETGSPDPSDYLNLKDVYTIMGGLRKTASNGGIISCDDAGRLFAPHLGALSVRLSLPYAVENGIYALLAGGSNRTLTDLVIWGVNFGDYYISQPGIYAAFTPSGIEFTIWTSAGRQTIRDTVTTAEANKDILLEFVWDWKKTVTGLSMRLYVNGVLTASGSGDLAEGSFSELYEVIEEGSSASSQ